MQNTPVCLAKTHSMGSDKTVVVALADTLVVFVHLRSVHWSDGSIAESANKSICSN